ncbi:hypothetical protein [Blastococcus sp. TBT05-19]|uniref:hypothetical protein n=1 Tax=Blastococcus sp. TBT05-19 TaxID=2250581 RepID=UPI0011BF45DD|nr:hypothetical protein [Blastococcus sp. TBT05-19]
MAKLDNPAGRLHTVLTAFMTEASANKNILETWQQTLKTHDAEQTLIGVSRVAGLVPEIEQSLIRVGDSDQLSLFYELAGDWVSAVIFPRNDFRSMAASNYLPDRRVLSTLAAISGFLSIAASEGPVPAEATIISLHDDVRGLIRDISEDTELPTELKREVVDHLHRIANALASFQMGGPDAVKAALDRLRITIVFAPEPAKKTEAWKRVAAVGGAVWITFTSSPVIAEAIESWGQIVQMLPPGGA